MDACGGGGAAAAQGSRRNRPRTRGRKAAKRATFPYINSQIIAVAETGDLNQLVAAIGEYLPEMNLVNISTAMHRLAKLTANDLKAQDMLRRHPVFSGLLNAARGALVRSETGGAPPQCQALSNITWSLATVQCADLMLLEIAANLSYKNVEKFKPFELSATLWGFAKLDSVDRRACECSWPLFLAASEHIPRHVEEFTFRCLVMIAWAFATARQKHEVLFRGIAQPMLSMVHTAQCQELANAAWAFSTAGFRDDRLFAELSRKAIRQLGDFKPQELSNMLWGFAVMGYFREDFFVSAALAAQSLDLQAQQLANILWALAKLRPHHRSTSSAVLALVPRCTRMILTFKPQELSSVALAAAKAFGRARGEMQDTGDAGGQPQNFQGLPPVVQEFFAAALPCVVPRLREYSGQSLANIATSFLAVQVGGGSDFYHALGRELLFRTRELETTALFLLLRNLPAAPPDACGQAVQALFREAASRVPSLDTKELQVLSRVCAGLQGRSRSRTMSPQELQKICQSLGEASSWLSDQKCSAGDVLFEALPGGDAADEVAPESPKSSGQGAQHYAAAWSETGESSGSGGADAAAASAAAASSKVSDVKLVNFTVKNTFIDIQQARVDEEEDEKVITLPPPLEIVPDTVSAEKLEEYRYNYQNFRSGKSTGAKGEVTEVTILDGLDPETARVVDGLDLACDPHRSAHPPPKDVEVKHVHVPGSEQGDSNASSAGSKLPPCLDFMPRFIDVQHLETFRSTYRSFREGNAIGAKGEIEKVVVPAERKQLPRVAEPAKTLPPPLGIIPQDIAPEDLEVYRERYQSFRAGNAVGAKGEVSSIKEIMQDSASSRS